MQQIRWFVIFLAGVLQCILAVSDDSDFIRRGPQHLRPGTHGIGQLLPDFSAYDLSGQLYRWSDFGEATAVVFAMTNTGCPICQKYAPTLARLEQQFQTKGVTFVYVNPNKSEDADGLKQMIRTHGFQGPYVHDADSQLTAILGATTSTEVFVVDKARTLVYRGAVDDQYGFGYTLPAPRRTYLVDALEAVLARQSPRIAATSAPGCEIDLEIGSQNSDRPEITYHNRISRIIQRHCLECHRPEGPAPFSLATYEELQDYAAMVRNVVERRVMPPWFAAPHDNETQSGVLWANDRSLSDVDRSDLLKWLKNGTPLGDPSDAPVPRQFTDGWTIGTPDAVFEFAEPVEVQASGQMPYQNIVIDTNLDQDRWVQAIEIQPGVPAVVHHVLVFVLPPQQGSSARERRQARENNIDYWGIYVPGNGAQIYPEGYARRLIRGARLRFQMHYTPNGIATKDRTKIGLVFADQKPRHEVKTASIVDFRFQIPPGADNHLVTASLRVPTDVQILGFLPHHHLRGKASRYELITPTGQTELLLDVPRYDFNWQLFYEYAAPRLIARGSTLRFTAWYDNSADNPANPDPTIPVGWGEQTDDEMHIGYVEYTAWTTPEPKQGLED
jgi:peroxiredoxin/primosomal replication protein N